MGDKRISPCYNQHINVNEMCTARVLPLLHECNWDDAPTETQQEKAQVCEYNLVRKIVGVEKKLVGLTGAGHVGRWQMKN